MVGYVYVPGSWLKGHHQKTIIQRCCVMLRYKEFVVLDGCEIYSIDPEISHVEPQNPGLVQMIFLSISG